MTRQGQIVVLLFGLQLIQQVFSQCIFSIISLFWVNKFLKPHLSIISMSFSSVNFQIHNQTCAVSSWHYHGAQGNQLDLEMVLLSKYIAS